MPYDKYHVRKRDLFTIALGSEPGFVQAVKAKQKKMAAKKAEEEAAAAATASKTTSQPSDTKTTSATQDADKANKKQDGKNENSQGGESKDSSKPSDAPSFTPEQDKQLLKMKMEEGKTWKEISDAIGRSVSTVKARFKEIKPADGDKPAEGTAEKKEESKENKKEEPEKKEKKAEKKQQDQSQPIYSAPEDQTCYVQLTEDELFSFEELKMLTEIMHEDFGNFYARVRDRFYDATNRRLKVEFIQAKCRAEQYPDGDPYC